MPREQPFNTWDPTNATLLSVAQGDIDEAKLLRRALDNAQRERVSRSLDNVAIANFRRSFYGEAAASRGSSFRDYHRLHTNEVRLNLQRLAFAGPPDSVREEHSAFCAMMYFGYQARFLDRHPGEDPEEFLDRPRKTTLNLTRIAIDILSQLYASRPTRELQASTAQHIRDALAAIWSDQYDLDMLDVDRFTRLEGTVGVRPIYDADAPGCIRLMLFHSYQLRVIPDPVRPWAPLAVIERHEPFMADSRVNIWTAQTFVTQDEEGTLKGEPHAMGRIPITFFKNRRSSPGAFFVEGNGRGLCDKNTVINGKLTDLNEVFAYQGFSVPVVTNHQEDELVIGPRRPLRFDDVDANTPHGLTFAQPNAPLGQLRQEVEADMVNLFTEQRIPLAALGARLDQRAVSGRSIREALKPLRDDFAERARLFSPLDKDLADNCLRVLAEHHPAFAYDPRTEKPDYFIDYVEPELPMGTSDQLAQDSFDIAQGITTPVDIMMRDRPGKHPDREGYVQAWQRNVEEINSVVRPGAMVQEPGPFGMDEFQEPLQAENDAELARIREAFQEETDTPLLDALMGRHGLNGF